MIYRAELYEPNTMLEYLRPRGGRQLWVHVRPGLQAIRRARHMFRRGLVLLKDNPKNIPEQMSRRLNFNNSFDFNNQILKIPIGTFFIFINSNDSKVYFL